MTLSTDLSPILSRHFLIAVLSAVFYALLMISGKNIRHTSTYATTWIQTLVGVIVLLPFVRLNAFAHLSLTNWAFIAATGLIHTGVVFYLFFNSIKQLPTHITALLIFLDPSVAILLDVLITGFHPSLLQNLRIALIFLAMSMSLFKKQPKALPERNNKTNEL